MKIKHDMVCGFLFNPENTKVVLIRKNRPDWQKGKLNGVGGHIEPGETPLQAMVREFQEEAGLRIDDWSNFMTLTGTGGDWRVNFFSANSELWNEVITRTTEQIHIVSVAAIYAGHERTVANLAWLIPMAIAIENDAACRFEVIEHFPHGMFDNDK